ncbi:MAG: response regulator [Deltaproteobacteria bacterium]|nr:response regulator [Deltaproteobacteria bacterium]
MSYILVVEDDARLRTILRDILEQQGHTVREAVDGEQGLAIAHRENLDLVIVDILLPGGREGIELIIDLHRHFSNIKIIAISGGGKCDAQHYLDMAKEFGAHLAIRKPFDQETLIKAVESLLAPTSA